MIAMQASQAHPPVPDLHQRVTLWTAVCGISSIPSFTWAKMSGPADFDTVAMLTGIVVVIIIYVWATGTQVVVRLQARPRAARAFRIGYLVRLFLSSLFPLGMGVDMIPGLLSVLTVETLSRGVLQQSGGIASFPITLCITLLQGLFLNLIGFVFMGLVYLVLPRSLDNQMKGLCERCGYDLRASYEFGRCPECGTPCVPPPDWDSSQADLNGRRA